MTTYTHGRGYGRTDDHYSLNEFKFRKTATVFSYYDQRTDKWKFEGATNSYNCEKDKKATQEMTKPDSTRFSKCVEVSLRQTTR